MGAAGGGVEEKRCRQFCGNCFGFGCFGHKQWDFPANGGQVKVDNDARNPGRQESGGGDGNGNPVPNVFGGFSGGRHKCDGGHLRRNSPLNEAAGKKSKQQGGVLTESYKGGQQSCARKRAPATRL